MLTHVMKVQTEITHSYDKVKDDFDIKFFKTDIDPYDILNEDVDYE